MPRFNEIGSNQPTNDKTHHPQLPTTILIAVIPRTASRACQTATSRDAPAAMNVFDRLERRWGWLSFPGFLRYFALFQVMVFVLQIFRPDLSGLLAFDRDKIFAGEIWRVATMFFAEAQFGKPSIINILLLIFAVNFIFMVNDGLEEAWGSFKTSLFCYTGILLTLAASFLYPVAVPFGGAMLFSSALLAFATLFPKVEILLFLIIPVQIRFIGMFLAFVILMTVISLPILLPFYLATLVNYFVWAAIPALKGKALVLDASKRKKLFNHSKLPASAAFHTCTVCKRTDISDPYLEFRIGPDGEDYCVEHLPE